MQQVRWIALGLALVLLAAKGQDSSAVSHGRPFEIEGIWEIVAVHRDGEADPLQLGAHLTFANSEVKFESKVGQLNFNAFS